MRALTNWYFDTTAFHFTDTHFLLQFFFVEKNRKINKGKSWFFFHGKLRNYSFSRSRFRSINSSIHFFCNFFFQLKHFQPMSQFTCFLSIVFRFDDFHEFQIVFIFTTSISLANSNHFGSRNLHNQCIFNVPNLDEFIHENNKIKVVIISNTMPLIMKREKMWIIPIEKRKKQ